IENAPIVFANDGDSNAFEGTTYIIEEFEPEPEPEPQNEEYTEVIPYNEEDDMLVEGEEEVPVKIEESPKRRARGVSKVAVKEEYVKEELGDDSIFMSDEALKKSITKLLSTLIDDETLTNLGWPDEPVENVLSALIKQCGHTPSDYTDCVDYTSKMRENAKILFTVVIENDVIKSMLNNHLDISILVSHIKYTHEGEKPLECAECGRTYLRKEELIRHMEMHNGIKNYICETCNKKFSTRTALNSHLHIHQPVDPSACT
uniref:C2H2-type domain-containing protein n=1 Tax=Phlebotomus papatasi TaxID=29031 RepID=A0A1B0D7Z2_PHLPP